jgi:hypothetical protein
MLFFFFFNYTRSTYNVIQKPQCGLLHIARLVHIRVAYPVVVVEADPASAVERE